MPPALILSSDSHVFEPPDLWTTRIDRAFRARGPRLVRIDGADQLVVEEDQILSGIGLISNAGARFEAPETISGLGRFEDVHRRLRTLDVTVERLPELRGVLVRDERVDEHDAVLRLDVHAADLLVPLLVERGPAPEAVFDLEHVHGAKL